MRILLIVALVTLALVSASFACDKEQYVKEAFFYVNGKEHAHGDEKMIREMILSSTGVHHHRRMKKAVFNAFHRPRANILFLVDESSATCTSTPRKIQKITKRFWKRLSRHNKQPFVVSVANSVETASAPVQRILAKNGKARIAYFDQQKQSVIVQGSNQELYHFDKKFDAVDVATEFEGIKAIVSKLQTLKTDAEKNSHAPDFYFFTISSLKAIATKYGKQSAEYTAARKQVTDAIAEVLASFNNLYENEKIVSQVMFTEERVASAINMEIGGNKGGRKLMATADVFIVSQTSNSTSNDTTVITPFDIANYQIWVWTWIVTIVLLLVGFYIMYSIDYSADCLNYAADFASKND